MVALLVLALLVLAGGHFYLKSDHGQNRIKAGINEVIPGHIDWESIDMSLVGGNIRMYGAMVTDPEENPIIDAGLIFLDIDIIELLRGSIDIAAHLGNPRVMLSVDRNGELNIVRAFVPPSPETTPPSGKEGNETGDWEFPLGVILRSVTIADGFFTFQDHSDSGRESPGEIAFNDIHVEIENADLRRISGRISVDIGSGIIDMEDAYLPLSKFYCNAVMDDGQIKPLAAGISLEGENGAHINLSGTIDIEKAFRNGLLATPTDLDTISYGLTVDADNIDFDRLYWTEPYMSGITQAMITVNGTGIFPKTLSAEINAEVSGRQVAAMTFLAPIDPEIAVKGRIQEGKAFADPIEITVEDSLLRVIGEYDIFSNTIDAAVDLDTPDMAQFLEPLFVAVTSGEASLSGTIAGPLLQPDIHAAAQSKNLAYETIRFGDVRLNASLDKSGRVLIERLFADNRGSQLDINGRIDLFEGGFAGFRFDMPADLTAVLQAVEVPDFYPEFDLRGKIDGTLHVTDKITAPEAALSINATDLAYDETRIGDLKAAASFSDGTAAIDELRLANGQSLVRLTGTVDVFTPGSLSLLPVPNLDLAFEESNISLGDFMDPARGRIIFHGRAAGDINDLEADFSLTGTDLEAAGNVIGDMEARLGFARGRLSLTPLEIINNRSKLAVTGNIDLFIPDTLDLHEDPAIDLKIAADEIYVDDFLEAMSGRLSVSGKVNGSLGNPKGEIALNGNRIDLGVQQIESLRLSAIFEDRTVFLDTAHITLAPGETIRAGGNISLDNRFVLEIDSDDIHIHRIGLLADAGITGKMRIEAAGEGSLDDPEMKGSLSIFDLAIKDNAMAPVDVTFTLNDSIFEALVDDGFVVEAAYRLDTGDFDWKGTFDETTLDPFLHTADFGSLSGTLTGTLRAKGNISEPFRTSADLSIETLRIRQEQSREAPLEMITVSGFSATLDDGAFFIPRNEIRLLGTNPFTVSGSGRTDGNFTFRAEGEIPLSTAALFYPELKDPEGKIDFSGTISRTDGTPDMNAEIRLHDIGLAVPVLMQKLSQTNGRIRVAGKTVTVEDVAGRLDGGRFTTEGSIDLEESFHPGQARLRVNAHALPIRIPELLETTINGEMIFSGTPDRSRLSGQVVFLDGLYYRDVEINLIQEVTQRRRRGAAATGEAADYDMPYLKNLSLNIDTSFRKPLMVDNNLALMTLRPEIRINGTLNQPSVTGRAEVGEGTVTYQNMEFDIARGVIDFIDPYRIQPEIDIRATSNVRKWTILLEIYGTPDDIRFKLTSNPPEEHADILSLLLLGKTTRELAEGTGPAGASPEEMLVNLLADRLEEDIRAGTGLDIVEVEYTNGDAAESDPSMRVMIGKELSRRLIVTYGVERKSGETFHQQTAIYRLLEFLSLNAFQDTGGTYGGEMQFRLEFR